MTIFTQSLTVQSDCDACNGSIIYGTIKCFKCGEIWQAVSATTMSDPLDRMMTEVLRQRDALKVRLHAAEALLERADAVIEMLLGDERHLHAEEVCSAIEQHLAQYPDPEGP
jgi:hypothetical protein